MVDFLFDAVQYFYALRIFMMQFSRDFGQVLPAEKKKTKETLKLVLSLTEETKSKLDRWVSQGRVFLRIPLPLGIFGDLGWGGGNKKTGHEKASLFTLFHTFYPKFNLYKPKF